MKNLKRKDFIQLNKDVYKNIQEFDILKSKINESPIYENNNSNNSNKNLIYITLFCEDENAIYLNYFELFLKSYINVINDNNIDFLIITNNTTYNYIIKIIEKYNLKEILYFLTNINLGFGYFERYRIFEWQNINNYKLALYLDCDIILIKNLNKLFDDINLNDNDNYYLYVMNAHYDNIYKGYTGLYFLKNENTDNYKPINSGQFIFYVNGFIKELFNRINIYIENIWDEYAKAIPHCMVIDQIVFNFFIVKYNIKVDYNLFNKYAFIPNYDIDFKEFDFDDERNSFQYEKIENNNDLTIVHFAGGGIINNGVNKYLHIKKFYNSIKKNKHFL